LKFLVWCSQESVKAILKDITPTERARQEIIHELYLTEQAYVDDLNLIIVVNFSLILIFSFFGFFRQRKNTFFFFF